MTDNIVKLAGIEDIEVIELTEALGSQAIKKIGEPQQTGGAHGDFGLTACLLILGGATLMNFATWLAMKRVKSVDNTNTRVTRAPDGTITIDIQSIRRQDSTGPPDPKVIKQLQEGLLNLFDRVGVERQFLS